jgi:hypothetical protein
VASIIQIFDNVWIQTEQIASVTISKAGRPSVINPFVNPFMRYSCLIRMISGETYELKYNTEMEAKSAADSIMNGMSIL